jgi:hypothetical protein
MSEPGNDTPVHEGHFKTYSDGVSEFLERYRLSSEELLCRLVVRMRPLFPTKTDLELKQMIIMSTQGQ